MKKTFKMKKILTLVLAAMMLVTSLPVGLLAETDYNYDNLDSNKSDIVNNDKLAVEVAKPKNGETAEDLISNPAMPEIYTLRTDYKVQRGEKYEINYQPYIASVGEAATDEEKANVNKEIFLPELAGYEKPQDSYNITYDTVKNAANGTQDFKYKAKANIIRIKHVFQNLEDFNKYTNPNGKVGTDGELITTQRGNTGSTMEVIPLDEKERKGFVPESDYMIMQVPENAEDFILEYRYNRDHYDVVYNTDGGTLVPNRTLYYEQIIPKLDEKSVPTKAGYHLIGWKPSVDLKTKDGKIFNANETINGADGKAILNLDANLIMPASDVSFTAVWEENVMTEYVIQFWTEKTDYDDKDDSLPLRERYDFIGSRRIDNADTGSTPDLTNLDIHGITFPDLNDGRLEKAQNDKEEFERYYFLNEELTKKQNASEKDSSVQKSVLSTGETVYNVYYDRRVYTLYFTTNNEAGWDPSTSYWPTLTRNGQVIGKEGSPYKVEARFNQSLDKIWPRDEEISGLPPASSDPGGDMGPIGWTINVNEPGELIFRDTPPYRLSAEDFIDSQDVVGTGDYEGNGHGDQIPIGENETKARGKYEISLAASSWDESVVHHIDIIKDDFEGNEQIDYDLSYWKSDTNASYEFILPHLQGFTLKKETRDAEWVLEKPTTPKYRTINDVNTKRNEITPFRSDADKIEYIAKFPWGTKLFDGRNRYNFANYSRNKYKLKLNNDPKTVKNDNEYTLNTDMFEVPYEMPLNDLKLDTDHAPIKPDWVPEDWGLIGWALDPAGDNLLKDGHETKLHYDQVLYAKWGEPDYKWTVTFDADGGSLKTIDEKSLATENKTIKEDVDGKETEITYPVKESSQGDKQIFTVIQRQKLVEPKFKPTKRGYDFMGWEIIRYKKNDKGDYTDEIDDSYRKTYKVPELYSFGNEVVSPIYLKAIWVPNQKVDVKVIHHILDKDCNQVREVEEILSNKRIGYLVATTGDKQNDELTLVPHDELIINLTGSLKTLYEEYNLSVHGNNTYLQQFRVESEKIKDPDTGDMIDNPDYHGNEFHFFYRPFRKREYKVNYIDERFKDNPEKGKIIDQELVSNGNRHFDARNYRQIPGWVLTSAPQQQLFFDLNEETNEFLGINGTKSDEITFYYKDVRVIEIPTPPEGQEIPDPPKGYVRVTFKAADGGSFGTKANGDPIKELYYDVIKGLKSDLLPVPKELKEGETADANKYYITPDAGRKFSEWDKQKLLNDNTIIDREYTFTANFVWSDVKIDALVVTESFKDINDNWINNFVPSTDTLKKQIHWFKNGEEQALPDGSEVIFDANIENTLYNEVKEFNNNDTEELVRTINVPAKIKFADNSIQDINIPVKIYKNVYEGLTSEAEQKLLNDALKDPDGELFKITGPYVKVTVNPTGEPQNKDSKVYYVNKNAWVNIPEIKFTDADKEILGSTYWSANDNSQNEDGVFDFNKRHKFTKDTVITLGKNDDVIEQKGKDKPNVPENYVKVTVDTTELSSDNTYFVRTFWVNPEKEVWLAVNTPTGASKFVKGVFREFKFSGWKTTKPDDSKTYSETIFDTFTEETYIVATYKYDDNVEAVGKNDEWIPQGSNPSPKDFIENPYDDNDPNNPNNLPPGTKFEFVPGAEPETQTPGTNKETTIRVIYPNGEVKEVPVKYNVTGDVVEQTDPDNKPDVPDDFVKVIVDKTENAELQQDEKQIQTFWVNPDKIVTIPVKNPTGKVVNKGDGTKDFTWLFTGWDKELTQQFTDKETTITAQYTKDFGNLPEVKPIPEAKGGFIYTELGRPISDNDYKREITLPDGYSFDTGTTLEMVEKTAPNINRNGRYNVDFWVTYPDGSAQLVEVLVYVGEARPEPQPSKPQIIYRDRIVEKEKIVEKIVKIKDNERLKELRYMQGYNGKFRPYDGLRRSEAAQILANALKADGYAYDPYYPISYTDIGDTWYTEAVRIVSQAGVFQGYNDGTFKPEGKITRAEWVATLRRFQDLKKVSGNDMGLSIGHWATEEIEAAYQAGWLDVYTSGIATFDANAPITRQEVAAVSNKAFDRVLDKVYLQRNVKNMINYKDINPSMPLYEDILCASNTLLTDGKYYKANTIILDNLTFNIVTDDLLIYQKKFQYISR